MIMSYEITHKDIHIISEQPVTWEQKKEPLYKGSPILETQEHPYYRDYRPTALQFELFSSTTTQSIQIEIPYQNRLTSLEAKHSLVCKYDEQKQGWQPVEYIIDTTNKKIIIKANEVGLYGVFVNYYWYSSYTPELASEFPRWSRIRKTKESTGQRFLNFFGIHFEEIKEFLTWISEQKYIGTADIHVYDWIYMYELMEVKQTDEIQIWYENNGAQETVQAFDTLREFFFNPTNRGGIIDYDKRRFYSKVEYPSLWFRVQREGQVYEFESKPVPFHVWNSLDDIGLLVGVRRLYLEPNVSFKERILDVFRYPANTSDEGLTNGIARELDMVQRIVWKDDNKAFYLKNTSGLYIDPRTLRVDGQPLNEDQYVIDEESNILIHPLYEGKEHVISFMRGIEKYELHDQQNEKLHRILFLPNGQATETFRNWVKYIRTVAPIMWDEFRWDEGFWDTIDKNLTGVGYLPNMWDSDIEVWRDYTFDPKRWESEKIW
jgi:hypothetical protein